MSQLVSEPLRVYYIAYDSIFENHGEGTLRCPYKDYSSLNRWQANRDLLSIFTFLNLLPVTMHLRQGKKVSILVSGDVNSGPVASRRGLLEAIPIMQGGADVCRATSHDRIPWTIRDPGMSCGHFCKT
jgi:hypothetical protein